MVVCVARPFSWPGSSEHPTQPLGTLLLYLPFRRNFPRLARSRRAGRCRGRPPRRLRPCRDIRQKCVLSKRKAYKENRGTLHKCSVKNTLDEFNVIIPHPTCVLYGIEGYRIPHRHVVLAPTGALLVHYCHAMECY